jgi:hypothetical protein
MIDVLVKYQPQVPFACNRHPVQTLMAGAGDPPFSNRVAPHRQLHPIRMIGTSVSV